MATAAKVAKAVTPKPVSNIRTLFGLNDVEGPGMVLPDDYYSIGKTPMVMPDLRVGLELEIENFRERDVGIDGFRYEEDRSLRNNGRECITHPTKTKHLENLLTKFFTNHKVQADNYSDRCSTHVHMNAQDMTLDQVKALALTYQTVERLMFQFVGHERDENLYCVPWYTAGVTVNFVNKFKTANKVQMAAWVKYTAANLQPLTHYGTIEFRHLQGTCDVPLILDWVNLIACLKKYATTRTFTEVVKTLMDMNTVSNYDAFLNDIYGDKAKLLTIGNYKELLSIGVLDSKIMLTDPKNASRNEVDDGPFFDDDVPPPPMARAAARAPARAPARNMPGAGLEARLRVMAQDAQVRLDERAEIDNANAMFVARLADQQARLQQGQGVVGAPAQVNWFDEPIVGDWRALDRAPERA